MPAKAAGRVKVRPVLTPLPANQFYAGIKKKPGPKRKLLSDKLRVPPRPVESFSFFFVYVMYSFVFG